MIDNLGVPPGALFNANDFDGAVGANADSVCQVPKTAGSSCVNVRVDPRTGATRMSLKPGYGVGERLASGFFREQSQSRASSNTGQPRGSRRRLAAAAGRLGRWRVAVMECPDPANCPNVPRNGTGDEDDGSYSGVQCAQGSSGPLCANCAEGYM